MAILESAKIDLRIFEMKDMFTFQNFPMVIIVALIAVSWLSFLSVIFFG